MYRWLFLATFLFGYFFSFTADSQEVLEVDVSDILGGTKVDLIPFAYAMIDSSGSMSLDDVQKANMIPYADLESLRSTASMLPYPLWLRFALDPDHEIPKDSLAIHVPQGNLMRVYEVKGSDIHFSRGGAEVRKHSSQIDFSQFAFPVRILDDSIRTIFLRMTGYGGQGLEVELISVKQLYQEHVRIYFENRIEFQYWWGLVCAWFFLGIFFLFRYLQYHAKYLLWYSLYLIAMAFNHLAVYESATGTQILWSRLDFHVAISFSFVAIPFIFFGYYLLSILELHPDSRLYKLCRLFIKALFLALICSTIANIVRYEFNYPVTREMHRLFFFPSTFIGARLAWLIWRKEDRLYKLIGTGMMIFMVACFVFSILIISGLSGHLHLIVEIAIIIEIIFLSLAIGHKTKMVTEDLLETQSTLLNVQAENLKIQENLNTKLTRLVDEKSRDIVEKNKLLAIREKSKLEAELNEKIANAELKALKAQMNPHFIFNCLNAIRNLIQHNNNDLATDYLSDFSSFIRKVLTYSEIRQITLEEELNLCRLYLRMEQLRFKKDFTFQIKVDEGTAVDFIRLPPMLLQPLLENAIWHGLLHKDGERRLVIHVYNEGNGVVCEVDDNGVGRQNSAVVTGSTSRPPSMGMKLFLERLEVNNKLLDDTYHYEIQDKETDGKSEGTCIKLYFDL